MLGKTKTKLGRIGIEGIVVGIVLCMLVGMIPAQAAQAEGTETMDDTQYTIYGTVYGIDGITPAKDVFVMATNTTGYGNYTYTDENGNYTIVLNWTYNIGDLVNVTAVNGIRMGNTLFTVTTNTSMEVDVVLQTMPEWWPSDPREISFGSESGNSTSKTSSPIFGAVKQGQTGIVSKTIKANMENYNADLVISGYQEYGNTEINLYQCNLIIESGGHLVLRNTTVTVWNNDTEAKYGISVLSNETSTGILEVLDNSIIQAQSELDYYYHFNVYGRLLVDHSTIKWMSSEGLNHTNPDVTMPSGIRLYPDSRCTIQNNTVITNGRTHNIYADAAKKLIVKDSGVLLAGNSTRVGYGVYATDASRVTIEGSDIVGCANHGVYADECILEITHSRISENGLLTGDGYGIYCHSFSPTMSLNNITNNNGGIYCHSSSPTIAYNNITDNLIGVRADFSSPTISHNYIQDGKKQESTYGVYSYFSSFTANNNTVSGYNFGFYLCYSPLTILNNHVLDNLIGVYLDNSGATILGNNVSGNYGAGIFSEYSTGVKIVENNLCENTPFGKLVESGTLEGAEGYGVYAKKSSIVIENNSINGNGRAGIYYAESNGGVYHGTIIGNTLNNHYTFVSTGPARTDGITIGTGVFCVNASLTISDNEISANVEGITSVSSSTTISSNDIDSNEGFSQSTVYFPGFGGLKGHWVTITSTIGGGVYTEDSVSTISNNNIDGNHDGILCEYNSYADIVNNNITSNDYGLWFDESSSGDWSITDISVVRDNEIWLNGNLTVYNGGSIALQTTASRSQCYFMLNPKQDGMYQIEVLNGGTLTADNFGFYSATDYHYLFKVRNSADLTLTGWSGIGYCGYNSTSPENMGLFIESNNVLIENCWFQENYCGIVLSGVDIDIVNTTFDYNTLDLYLRGASVAECLNITFDENKVCFEDGVSILNVSWYLHVETTDETATPIENAQVEIYDKNSNLVFIGFTGTDGTIKNIPIQEYAKSSSGKVVFTPHRVEVVKTGVGSAEVYVNVTSSQVVSLILVNTPPELSLGQVLPTSGYTGIGINATTFTYTVTYTDVENDAPDICVYIDNVSYNMSKDASDEDYTDGCIYVFTTILSHKNHTYYFEAMDWKDITTTPIFYGPEIINRPPYWVITTPPLTATAEYFYIYMAQAEDLDNDVLTYSLSVAPLGMSVNSTTGLVTWLPTKEQTGSNNVTLVADDGYGSIISQEFVVTVYLNYPPVLLKRLPLVTFDEDTTLRNAFNLTEYFVDINPEDIITYSCYGTMNVNVTINPNGTVDFSVKENWCGTETITFRATDPSGGYAECKVDITVSSVNDPPIVDAGLNQTVIANETYGSVRLTGTGYDPDGSIVLYEWNFGDGTPTWSSCYTGTTTHIYGTPGNYTATLKVTDNDGDTATDICTIYALEMGWDLPVANATIWNATAGAYNLKYNVTLVGETVNVSAWSSYDRGWYDPDTGESDPCGGAIVCYDWNWRDLSAHSGGCNTSHIYNKGQEYEIVLTVYDNQNFTATDTCIVLVVYRPTADAGPNKEVKMDTPVTLYGRGYFEDEPHGTIVNYIWEFGDGSYGFGASVTHSYTLADGEDEHNYTANLTVTDNYGFTGRDSCIIHVVRNYLPIADAGPDQEVSTYGADSVSVSLNGRGYDSDGWIEYYMWQFSDGTTYPLSTDGSITHTFYLDGKNEKTFTAWLTVTDNQGGHAQDKCIIRVVRNFLPEVYISPNYKATFGNKSVNFTAYAYDRDGSITNYAWQQDGADKVDYSNFPTGISCHYSKPGEIKKYIVKVTVTDNTGATATATATVKVYPNWKPIVFAGQNLASYVTNSEDSRNISFLFMCVDVDGDLKKLNVTFGDGESDETLDVVELTDAQKEAFAKQLQSITVDLSDPSENPLYGMLEDMMWMYDQGMLMIMEAGLMAIGFQAGPMSLMVDICSDVIMGILKGDYQKMLLGIATSIGTETASELAAKCLDLGEVFEAAGVFSLFMDASNIFNEAYERGREHSVANFMAWAYHDLSVKWGLEKSEPLITKEELMDRIVGYTVSHVYAPGGYPVTYPVTVSVTDDDNAEGEGTCDVFLFNNVYPFALTDKEIYGRVNENVTFHAYALDYERDINSWEWDFDNDGVFEWNSLSEMWVQGTSGPSYDMPNNLFGMYGVIGPMANHTYNTTGVHYATLRVTDSGGLNTTIPCKIMVYPLAEAGPDVSRKVNKNVSFSGTGWALNTEIQEYKWDCDGDGDFEHLQRNYKEHSLMYSLSTFSKLKSQNQYVFEGWFNVTDSFTLPGDWAATFKVIDQKNASATDQCRVTIHENRPPIANAGPDQTVKWNSMSVYFDASKSYDPDYGDRIYNYTWNFGDSTTTETTSPTAAHYYNRIGTFTVTLTVWDEDNATGTDSCIVTIMPDAGPDKTVWVGDTVNFYGEGPSNIVTWYWDFRDGNFGSGQSTTHAYFVPGMYEVTLIVTDNLGRTASDTCIITVIDNYIPEVSVGPEIGPEVGVGPHLQTYWGLPLTFYATACDRAYPNGSIVRYSWDFGDGTIVEGDAKQDQFYYYFNYTYTYSWFGEYVVNLTVWDEHGASNWTTCNVTIVNPYGDIFSPVGTVITLIEDTYSYQGTVTFVINVRDDTDRKPYVDV
ncbi:MAG: PKD domain-containing protein, partial [Thermoplasmatales archaeon]|nr:PKD domain-containing protein [Thermoplasmatales archaeon]